MKAIRQRASLGFAAGLVFGLVGCAPTTPPQQASAAADGARIWRATCSRCHNARPATEFTAAEWSVIVRHMRTRADLTKTEAAAVSAFLQASAEPGRPNREGGEEWDR